MKTLDNLLNMSNAEINDTLKEGFKNGLDTKWKSRIAEYNIAIERDFHKEWSKKKFKWLFKKYRQNKLIRELRFRHANLNPIFDLIAETVNEVLPQALNESFGQLVEVKNIEHPTCEFCGSTDTKVETAVSFADPLSIQEYHHIKCCNCGRILLKDYEEN